VDCLEFSGHLGRALARNLAGATNMSVNHGWLRGIFDHLFLAMCVQQQGSVPSETRASRASRSQNLLRTSLDSTRLAAMEREIMEVRRNVEHGAVSYEIAAYGHVWCAIVRCLTILQILPTSG